MPKKIVKKIRCVFEKVPRSGEWWIQYFDTAEGIRIHFNEDPRNKAKIKVIGVGGGCGKVDRAA